MQRIIGRHVSARSLARSRSIAFNHNFSLANSEQAGLPATLVAGGKSSGLILGLSLPPVEKDTRARQRSRSRLTEFGLGVYLTPASAPSAGWSTRQHKGSSMNQLHLLMPPSLCKVSTTGARALLMICRRDQDENQRVKGTEEEREREQNQHHSVRGSGTNEMVHFCKPAHSG